MEEFEQYLEDDFIVWNPSLGIRDFATIGEIQQENDKTKIWLDDPYEMVGPIYLEELLTKGEVAFAACFIMTKESWNLHRERLQRESFKKQQKTYERFNSQRSKKGYKSEKECRELLSLPLHSKLNISQIKSAYKKIAKTAHPDVGGSHEKFLLITEAKEILILNI